MRNNVVCRKYFGKNMNGKTNKVTDFLFPNYQFNSSQATYKKYQFFSDYGKTYVPSNGVQ